MITMIMNGVATSCFSESRKEPYEIYCLSTDTKPTTDVPNGSYLVEIDTGNGYLFDAAGSTWHQVGA